MQRLFGGLTLAGALEGLLLLPASPRALYYGKALANTLQLLLLGIALVPVMVILYDAGTTRLPTVLLIIILGSAGISAPGTLYSAMTSQARAKQTLLPLLLFPLIVPVLLGVATRSNGVLRLGHGHAVAGHHDDELRVRQLNRRILGRVIERGRGNL